MACVDAARTGAPILLCEGRMVDSLMVIRNPFREIDKRVSDPLQERINGLD